MTPMTAAAPRSGQGGVADEATGRAAAAGATTKRWSFRSTVLRAMLALALLVPLATWGQVRLLRPVPGETVHSNTGDVPVVVDGAPSGSRFSALIDGTPRGVPTASPSFVVKGVDRGARTLTVVVLDARGDEVARTGEVQFYVWQASRLFPNRRGGN